jgi:hypothetical protein
MKKPFEGGAYSWKPDVDYRLRPDFYRVGKGEEGVLICEPYKSELLPHWRFRTPEIATESSGILYDMFLAYLADDDFPGADMARKYLQMGFTRARRYANYKGGRKYADDGKQLDRGTGDPLKARSAEIFYRVWQDAEANLAYASRKADWKKRYG